MRRMVTEHCYLCGHTWRQPWAEPNDCPRCDGGEDDEYVAVSEGTNDNNTDQN